MFYSYLHVDQLKARQEQGRVKSASGTSPPDEKVTDFLFLFLLFLFLAVIS